jgi:hypothetical protein
MRVSVCLRTEKSFPAKAFLRFHNLISFMERNIVEKRAQRQLTGMPIDNSNDSEVLNGYPQFSYAVFYQVRATMNREAEYHWPPPCTEFRLPQ